MIDSAMISIQRAIRYITTCKSPLPTKTTSLVSQLGCKIVSFSARGIVTNWAILNANNRALLWRRIRNENHSIRAKLPTKRIYS
jgi:hypothetical protein